MPVRQVLTCKRVHLSGSEAGAGKTQLASVDGTSHTGLLPLADRRTGRGPAVWACKNCGSAPLCLSCTRA